VSFVYLYGYLTGVVEANFDIKMCKVVRSNLAIISVHTTVDEIRASASAILDIASLVNGGRVLKLL
jgi:hypothetical protein